MKKTIGALLCAMMLAVMPCALAAQITVQGSGAVTAVPDMVTVTANASVTAETMLDAQTQVSGIVADVTQRLAALGVAETDVVTSSYNYYPQYSYEGDVRRLVGYQASHTLEITCRDTALLNGVIGAVTDSGMSEIYSVSFDVSSRGELYNQALALAIGAAESKAMTMAGAGGKTLTGLVSLTENGGYDARYAVTASLGKADTAVNTGIRSGSVSVTASVTAVYEAQ